MMKKINDLMLKMYTKATCAMYNLKNSERGDTNFVSILLIVAVVVVLAGLFLTFGREALNALQERVIKFINNPKFG